MDYKKLAQLLFPHINKSPEEYEKMYPERDLPKEAKVTRLGPSPTGFMHLGNLYGAFVDERMAHQSNGVFYLRIEDTDDKRYVEGAVETIIDSLESNSMKVQANPGTWVITEIIPRAVGAKFINALQRNWWKRARPIHVF